MRLMSVSIFFVLFRLTLVIAPQCLEGQDEAMEMRDFSFSKVERCGG